MGWLVYNLVVRNIGDGVGASNGGPVGVIVTALQCGSARNGATYLFGLKMKGEHIRGSNAEGYRSGISIYTGVFYVGIGFHNLCLALGYKRKADD